MNNSSFDNGIRIYGALRMKVWLLKNIVKVVIVLFLIVALFLAALALADTENENNDLTVAVYVSFIGVMLALFQFDRTMRVQKANFIKEFVSGFHLNKGLQNDFFNLIYLYTDSKYELIMNAKGAPKGPEFGANKFFDEDGINKDKKNGERYYNIYTFTGSEEERRLDSVLYYFDIVAYYFNAKLLTIQEIEGTLGYFLDVLTVRKSVRDYINLIKKEWADSTYGKQGSVQPLRNLDKLIVSFEKRKEKRKIWQERVYKLKNFP